MTRLIDADALKKAFEDTVCISPMPYAFVKQIIDNAPTVEPYQGEEYLNIKMSEEEIKQFKKMLQEHTPLYTITSDTFVEGARAERPKGKWIMNKTSARGRNYTCTNCKKVSRNKFNFCPNCGADMRGDDYGS